MHPSDTFAARRRLGLENIGDYDIHIAFVLPGHNPPSALARNDPTLLAKSDRAPRRSEEAFARRQASILPVGKSERLDADPGPLDPLYIRPQISASATERPTRAPGGDDGGTTRTPSAWMISFAVFAHGQTCSKSCSWCGSVYPSTNGSFLPSAEALARLMLVVGNGNCFLMPAMPTIATVVTLLTGWANETVKRGFGSPTTSVQSGDAWC